MLGKETFWCQVVNMPLPEQKDIICTLLKVS